MREASTSPGPVTRISSPLFRHPHLVISIRKMRNAIFWPLVAQVALVGAVSVRLYVKRIGELRSTLCLFFIWGLFASSLWKTGGFCKYIYNQIFI
jgi:hypothetical protein